MKAILLTITLAANLAQAMPQDSAALEYFANNEWRCNNGYWQVQYDQAWFPWYNENGEPMEC
jgi:hypothetical protein